MVVRIDKKEIIKGAEKYFRENIPSSRIKEAYLRHVEGTRRYALLLAGKYNADKFIVEIAAWLHDVGANAGKEHPNESVKIAKKLLSQFDISGDLLEQILNCISNHSMGTDVDNLEEQVIQDADGIIFLEDTYKYFYEKGKSRASSIEEARKWAIAKTKGMIGKIKTKEGIRLAKKLLPKAIKYIEKN